MVDLVYAEPVDTSGRLTDKQVSQWRSQGFTFVQGLLPESLVFELKQAAVEAFPEPGSKASGAMTDFGSAGTFTFPSPVGALNQVTLDEGLLQAISDLLATPVEQLRLTQSDLWPKYGHDEKTGIQDNSDQRIHVDYPNHTLAHPTSWDRPEAVEMILYFDDFEETGGSTALVPREGPADPAFRWPIVDSPGIGDLRYINDRVAAESYFAEQRPELADWRELLYSREKQTAFKQGDLLLYRHDIWHRGTSMRPGQLRLVLNMTFRKASAEWISTLHVGWAWKAYRDNKYLERLIAASSLKQRAVLGFPQPGNEYWTAETIEAVEARYGMFGMDMTPYSTKT